MSQLDTIRLDLLATHAYLHVVRACLGALLAGAEGLAERPDLVHSLQLAVHEACINIVDHAYAEMTPGRIRIAITLSSAPPRLIIELEDTGGSFDLAAIPEPDLVGGQIRGYGLFLMRQILDEVVYESLPHGNRWRLRKELSS